MKTKESVAAVNAFSAAKRFTTYEVIEDVPIIVIKKDKSREVFDRTKGS